MTPATPQRPSDDEASGNVLQRCPACGCVARLETFEVAGAAVDKVFCPDCGRENTMLDVPEGTKVQQFLREEPTHEA